MKRQKVVSEATKRKIFRKNKGIDIKVVNAHERLERDLKKIGVEIKPEFTIGNYAELNNDLNVRRRTNN